MSETAEVTHTPGPWSVRDGESEGWSVKCEHGTVAAMSSADDCDEANARLIAAAPDLLAACKPALENIELEWGSECETARLLRAAIQKAEGR